MQSTVTNLQQQLQQSKGQSSDLQHRLDEAKAQNDQLRAQQLASCKSRPKSKGRQEPSRSPIKRRVAHSHSPPIRRRRLESHSPPARRHRQHSKHVPNKSRDDDSLYVVRNKGGADYRVPNRPIGAHPEGRTDWCPAIYTKAPGHGEADSQERTAPAGLVSTTRPTSHPYWSLTETAPTSDAKTLPPSENRGAAVIRENLTLEEYDMLGNENQERPRADKARATAATNTKIADLQAELDYWESWRQSMNAKYNILYQEINNHKS